MPDYLHVIDGRLRVKVHRVKRCPTTAMQVGERLTSLEGVTAVSANPVTGNVLVHYHSDRVDHSQILASLTPFGVNKRSLQPVRRLHAMKIFRHKVVQELALAGFLALVKFGARYGFRIVIATVA